MMGAATEKARLPRFSFVLGIESCCGVDDTGLSGDVSKMQETSQIRWLVYCKSAICKSGPFELDYVINRKPVKLFEQGK